MTLYIFLGLLNGICIALSRILNGQLSVYHGAFRASYINHLGGFIFLSLLALMLFSPIQLGHESSIIIYSGGVIGALYVAINSLVITKLGSTSAIVLVISGQMIFGLFLDSSVDDASSLLMKGAGVSLIIIGVLMKELFKLNRPKL
jgi:bacterial/archaeal transporter family-2 protein